MEIGYSVICFAVYLAVVVIFMLPLKRSIITSLFVGWVVLLVMSGKDAVTYAVDSVQYSFLQENEYALIMFGLMGFLMEATGMVGRVVNILNSIFGRIRGGSGYVSVFGCAAYGLASGSPMGCVATIGAVTIPWMKGSGFSTEDASTLACANSGLAIMVPPSTCFAIILSWPLFVSMGLSSGKLYIANLIFGAYLVIMRAIQCTYIIRRAGIPKPDMVHHKTIGQTFKENWSGLTLFAGTIIPVMATTGPLNTWLGSIESWGKTGNGAISLMTWLPMMLIIVILIEGWRYLPHTFKGITKLIGSSIGRFKELGTTLLLGYFAARVLSKMGLAEDMGALFESLDINRYLLLFIISLILFLASGPLSPTVVMNSVGPIGFAAMIALDVNPYAAAMVVLGFAAMGSDTPPSTPALYVAGGISGLSDVKSCFKDLLFIYAIPSFLVVYLYTIGIIPNFM